MIETVAGGASISLSRKSLPLLILSYDDGPIQDYTEAFPIHLRHGVPAELNVVSDLVGTAGFLSRKQLLIMQAAGWEVVSHTKSHKILQSTTLRRPAKSGDRKVYVKHVRFSPATCLIEEGPVSETVRIVAKGRDDLGVYAVLETPLRSDFEHGVIRLTPEDLIREISGGKQDLIEMGFAVNNFTFPFSRCDKYHVRLVSEYYDSARLSGNDGINELTSLNRYRLNAKNFSYLSKDKILSILDHTRSTGALCIMYTHTWDRRFSTDKLDFIIKIANLYSIKIVTRRQAIETIERHNVHARQE